MNHTIVVTEKDFSRLQALIDSSRLYRRHDQQHVNELEDELNRAQVVPDDTALDGTVSMYSVVRVTDLDNGRTHNYQVVLPHHADATKNRISVLAPIGTALLGDSTGSVIEWKVPGGLRRLRIDAVERPENALLRAA